jgi:hypothetical protein
MEKKQLLKTNFYTIEEWDLTPKGVKNFVVHQKQRIEQHIQPDLSLIPK